jgi:polyisoprenoid-binding protein YceI
VTGANGSWVVPSGGTGGFVGYRAAEILGFDFVRAPNEAVGRTDVVEGKLTVDGNRLTEAEVVADVSALRSDIDMRDGHIQNYLQLDQFPKATFTLSSPIDIGTPAQGRVVSVDAPGSLALHGVTRAVNFPLQARWNGDSIEVTGQLRIQRADFGMDVPQLLGFRVSDDITLELSLLFVRPGSDPCVAPTANPSQKPAQTVAPSGRPSSPPSVALDRLPTSWGQIAFMGLTSQPVNAPIDPGELFILSGGSQSPTQLTHTDSVLEDEPAWSPDRRRIAYASYSVERPPDLWIMGADGSGPRALTTGAAVQSPAWSPDGRTIVVVGFDESNQSLQTIDVGTGKIRPVPGGPGVAGRPAWSPDGRTIAFTFLPKNGTSEDVYVIRPDGSGLRQLTSDATYEYEPAWSPDGTRIAFVRDGDVWSMDADGRHQQRLTTGLPADSPTWSPDGRHLAFVVAGSDELLSGNERRDLLFVDVDGANLRRMQFDLYEIAHPAWRP